MQACGIAVFQWIGCSTACHLDITVRLAEKYGLTKREQEVAALLIAGKSQIEIAGELFISSNTAKTHIKNIYEKTGVSGKIELIVKAQE